MIVKILTFLFPIFIASHISAQQAIEYTYDNEGNRILRQVVTLTDDEPDDGDSKSLAVESSRNGFDFNLYPNPVESQLNVAIDEDFLALENKRLSLFSLDGKMLLEKEVKDLNEILDVNHLPSGQYLLRLSAVSFRNEWKLVKE